MFQFVAIWLGLGQKIERQPFNSSGLFLGNNFFWSRLILDQRQVESNLQSILVFIPIVLCLNRKIKTYLTGLLYTSLSCFQMLNPGTLSPTQVLYGVSRILKKLQKILWGQNFELQFDANLLIQMISSPNLPNVPISRWVKFIQPCIAL
jgi:hypothetical protein